MTEEEKKLEFLGELIEQGQKQMLTILKNDEIIQKKFKQILAMSAFAMDMVNTSWEMYCNAQIGREVMQKNIDTLSEMSNFLKEL
jgi:hypothetical protein